MKAVPRQQPQVCSTKLRISHTQTRWKGNSGLHKGPQPFQTIHKYLGNRSRKWQSSFVHAAFGEQTCSLCNCTWEGIISSRAVSGQSWPGDTSEAPRGSHRLHIIAHPQQHRHSQAGTGAWPHRDKAHPQLLWTTNTKMLYITSKELLDVLNVKHKYSDLCTLITFLYFNMTRFLRFTHNSAYLWVWRQLQYPYHTQP